MDRVETPFNGSVQLEIPRKTPLFSRWHSLMNSLPGSSIDHFREKDLFVLERSGFSRWHHVDPLEDDQPYLMEVSYGRKKQIIRVDWFFTCWPVKKPQISWLKSLENAMGKCYGVRFRFSLEPIHPWWRLEIPIWFKASVFLSILRVVAKSESPVGRWFLHPTRIPW